MGALVGTRSAWTTPVLGTVLGIAGAFLIVFARLTLVQAIGVVGGVLITAAAFRFPKGVLVAVVALAPAYDVIRARFLPDTPYIGLWQEGLVLALALAVLSRPELRELRTWRVVDALVVLYILWGIVAVIQSPSLTGGLYVWRWYSIGPLLYLVLRLFRFDDQDRKLLVLAAALGLGAAAMFALYQAFVWGGAQSATWSKSLGFLPFYRFGWRLSSSFSSPLVASASFGLLVLIGWSMVAAGKSQLIGLGLIAIGGVATAVTLSRSGFVIAACGIVGLLLARRTRGLVLFATLLLPVLAGGALISKAVPVSDVYAYTLGATSDVSTRVDTVTRIASDAATRYPLGRGFDDSGAISLAAGQLFGWQDARATGGDSVFFAMLRSEGWPGLLLLLAIFAYFIFSAGAAVGRRGGYTEVMALLSLGFFLGVTLTLANLVDVWPLKLYLWMFGALCVSARQSAQDEPRKPVLEESESEVLISSPT